MCYLRKIRGKENIIRILLISCWDLDERLPLDEESHQYHAGRRDQQSWCAELGYSCACGWCDYYCGWDAQHLSAPGDTVTDAGNCSSV